jgi:hypothetical protein
VYRQYVPEPAARLKRIRADGKRFPKIHVQNPVRITRRRSPIPNTNGMPDAWTISRSVG